MRLKRRECPPHTLPPLPSTPKHKLPHGHTTGNRQKRTGREKKNIFHRQEMMSGLVSTEMETVAKIL